MQRKLPPHDQHFPIPRVGEEPPKVRKGAKCSEVSRSAFGAFVISCGQSLPELKVGPKFEGLCGPTTPRQSKTILRPDWSSEHLSHAASIVYGGSNSGMPA